MADIEIITPTFDLNGYYSHHALIALESNKLSTRDKLTKLKSLIQRAYEQGMIDATKDKNYFDEY